MSSSICVSAASHQAVGANRLSVTSLVVAGHGGAITALSLKVTVLMTHDEAQMEERKWENDVCLLSHLAEAIA
jgi:hypothetical protein